MMTQIWVKIDSGNDLLPDGTITWINVDLSSVRSCEIDLKMIAQEMLKIQYATGQCVIH